MNYPSNTTVDDFDDHSLSSISSVFEMKTKKRLQLLFYYSPHTIHSLNKKDSMQHKCGKNPSRKIFNNCHHTNSLDMHSSYWEKWSPPVFQPQWFFNQKIWKRMKTLQVVSMNTLFQLSISVVCDRTDLSYPNVFRLQDVFDELSVKTIKSIISKLEDTSSVRFNQFPAKLLKCFPDLFRSLLCPLFASIILTQTYLDVWKTSFVLLLFKNGNISHLKLSTNQSALNSSITSENILFSFV